MLNELWAVLYSQTQGQCHIEPLADTVKHNRRFLSEGREPQYHLIAVCEKSEECDAVAQAWKKSGNAHNLHLMNYMELTL